MFAGLIPGLNSVNWPDDEAPPQVPAIVTILLNLPNQKFLNSSTFPATNAITQSLNLFRQEWSESECRSLVLLIYFCVFIPILAFALYSGKEENNDGGGEVAGESPETDDPPGSGSGSIRLFGKALLNAHGDFILPESYDPSESFCGICLEEKQKWRMFRSENCSHSFCYDCTSKHIEAKVQDNITVICCPEIGCKAELNSEACRNLVSKDIIVRWDECLCMSLIPESHKVYCPFMDCSAMLVNDTGRTIGETQCPACRRLICAKCRVPWHTEFTCQEFEMLGVKGEGREDMLVVELAKKKSWRKCPNCNMYVEKNEGCLHITCRCTYEFCYMCGSKWDKSHQGCRRVQEPETSHQGQEPEAGRQGQEPETSRQGQEPEAGPQGQEPETSRRGQELETSWNHYFPHLRPPPPPPSLLPFASLVGCCRGQESETSGNVRSPSHSRASSSASIEVDLPPPPPPSPPLPSPFPSHASSSASVEFDFYHNTQSDTAPAPIAPDEEVVSLALRDSALLSGKKFSKCRKTLSSFLSLNRP